VDGKDFTYICTFGVDSNGDVVTSGCPWGLKLEWTKKKTTNSKLVEYK
jgi:hypothetical protein